MENSIRFPCIKYVYANKELNNFRPFAPAMG